VSRFQIPLLPAACLTCVLIASGPACAIDLVASWQAARSHDATFAAAEAALAAALEKIPQGDAVLAARLDLVANAAQARQDYHSGDTVAQPSATTQGQQLGAALNWTKPIYDVAGAVARDRLHREAEQARAVYDQARQDLILRVARAYFDVLLAQDNLQLARAQEQAIGEQLGLARQTYELGLASGTDADDAQARYDNVVAVEVADRTDLEAKSDAFRTLTGLEPAALQPVSPQLLAGAPVPARLESLVAAARSANPLVRALELGVEIAHRQIDQYRAAATPVVSVVASYGRQLDTGSISTSGARDHTGNAALGLQLSMPLFDGGNRRSLERQAAHLEEQQAQSLEAARRDSERAARQYAASVRDGARRIESLDRARVSGESSVNSNRTGREVGVRTTIDVLNAEQTWYQTLYSLSTARCDWLFDRLQLAAQAGTLDVAALTEVDAATVKPRNPS
jgi:outer membrane protein